MGSAQSQVGGPPFLFFLFRFCFSFIYTTERERII
jgi:hypothetical protein